MKTKLVLSCLSLLLAILTGCAAPNPQNGVSINQTSRGVEIRSTDSILFDSGKYDIKPSGVAFLDRVAELLKTKTRNNVVIEGHTDNVGRNDFNQELSEMRALLVMKALIDRGVAKHRIKAVGFGIDRPIADNSTEEGRKLNRRTDIIILNEKKENLGNDPVGDLVQSVVDFSKNLFQ